MRPLFYLQHMTMACVLATCACAAQASGLRPAQIGDDQGAMFGRIMVSNNGEDVTGNSPEWSPPSYGVENKYSEAIAEYRKRHGSEASALEPVADIAGEEEEAPRVSATPETFSLGKDIAAAERACAGSGHKWVKVSETRFSCSGAPVNMGVPVIADLTACEGTICEVTLSASATDADWKVAGRYKKLRRFLVQSHGEPIKADSGATVDCAGLDAARCSGAGAADSKGKRAMWRIGETVTITLVLDTSPPAGARSLRVTYRNVSSPAAGPQGADSAKEDPR